MTMELISTTTLVSDSTSITLGSIPQTYTDILILGSLRGSGSGQYNATLLINGAGSGNSGKKLTGSGTSVSSTNVANYGFNLEVTEPNITSNTFSNFFGYVPNYALTSNNKIISVNNVTENNSSDAWTSIGCEQLASTSAVTSIVFSYGFGTGFVAGSTVSLYGILKGSGGASVS